MLKNDLFNEILEHLKEAIENIQSDNLSGLNKKIETIKNICLEFSIDDATVSEMFLEKIIKETKSANEEEAKIYVLQAINSYISRSVESLYRLALLHHAERLNKE